MGGVLSSPLMPMQIVSAPITRDELRRIAGQQFGDFVKAVVDVQGGVMAIGAELHGARLWVDEQDENNKLIDLISDRFSFGKTIRADRYRRPGPLIDVMRFVWKANRANVR